MIRFLIVIIHFYPMITLQFLQIDEKQGETIYNLTQKRLNQTFQLQISKQETSKFLLIELFVKLKSKSSANLVLLQSYGQAPFFDLNSEKKKILCDNYDLNGQQLSKKYHYLQLNLNQNSELASYLTILTNKTLSYRLVFTISEQEKCPNNCNNRGLCVKGKCKCKQGYLDEDCSQSARLFYPFKVQNFSISKQQYIYTIFNTTNNYRLSLSFDSDKKIKSKINIQMLISQNYNLPCSINNNFNYTIQDQKSVQIELLKESNFNVESSKNLLIIKLFSEEDIDYQITIDFQTHSLQQDQKIEKILLILFLALLIVFVFIVICCCCFRPNSRQKQIVYQNAIPQLDDLQENTQCSICLDDLQSNQEQLRLYVKTDCQHIFHKQCLDEWYQYKDTCPFCRKELQ